MLEANPNYRTLSFPKSADPAHADLVRSMKGKNLPQIGVIEVSLIAEELPLLLEFERGKLDYVEFITDVATRLLIDGNLKPELARRGKRERKSPGENRGAQSGPEHHRRDGRRRAARNAGTRDYSCAAAENPAARFRPTG